jgi:spore coat assembly protein
LILKLSPDIVVITGHDVYNKQGLKDLKNYSNTENYISAVRKIREIKSRGDLVIISGACQSNFEALIANGADFASSPKRINIHTFDPAVVAIKVATTSFNKIVNLKEALRFIDKGSDAFGGLETLGKMRLFV